MRHGVVIGLAIATSTAVATASLTFAQTEPTKAVTKLPSCSSDIGYVVGNRNYSLPTVGEAQETEIGGTMLMAATVNVAEEGVRLLSPVSFEGKVLVDTYVVTFPPGEYPNTQFAASMDAPNASFRYKGEKNDRHGIRRPEVFLQFESSRADRLNAIVRSPWTGKTEPVDRSQYELLLCERASTKAFRREILYSGGSKGAIQLQYREFANDMARPAFSQDLNFDLAMGKDIGFRGARIRIESISNTGVRYTVLKTLE